MHRGNPQSQRIGCAAYFNTMKARHEKALTFGEFIMAAYDTFGKRRAKGMVWLAVNAHLVEFQGPQRIEFSRRPEGAKLAPA